MMKMRHNIQFLKHTKIQEGNPWKIHVSLDYGILVTETKNVALGPINHREI